MTTTKAWEPSPEIVLLYRRVAEALHAVARENEKLATRGRRRGARRIRVLDLTLF